MESFCSPIFRKKATMPVPLNHLSLVIDPVGINLRVFPNGDTPIKLAKPNFNNQRSANGNLIVGGQSEYYDFECDFFLQEEGEFEQLRGLYSYKWAQRSKGLPFETVIYNLAEPFSEIATAPTRLRIPGTEIISTEPFGSGLTRYTYWIALQGVWDIEYQLVGDGYLITFNFVEGTKLTP